MSENFSILFVWSKGARQRRNILAEIERSQNKKEPIYVSKLSETLSKSEKNGEISISAIRKHVKVLVEYGFVEPINKGGKPEYLQLTDTGKKTIEKIKLHN